MKIYFYATLYSCIQIYKFAYIFVFCLYFLDKYTYTEVRFSYHEQQRDTKKRITRYIISHI